MTKKILNKKNTIGALAAEIVAKPLDTRDPIELAEPAKKTVWDEIQECIDVHKRIFIQSDFYIVIIIQKVPALPRTFRRYFAGVLACPTPDFDQSVFKYHWRDEMIEFLWGLPNEQACIQYKMNALNVIAEEKALLKDILDFYDGTLLELAKKLNGELPDAPQIVLEIRETPQNDIITGVS